MRRYSDNKYRSSQPRLNVVSRVQEKEFDSVMRNIEDLENRSRCIVKRSKQLSESSVAVGKAEYKILHNLMELAEDSNLQRKLACWSESLQAKDKARQDFGNILQRCMIEPMKKYNTSFPGVASASKKREQLIQEVLRQQAKVDKYEGRERTGTNLVRLQEARKALSTAKEEYEAHRKLMLADVPAFYAERVRFMEPCLQAVIQAEWGQHVQVLEANKATGAHFLQDVDLILSGSTYEEHLNAKLNEIKQLSIVMEDEREMSEIWKMDDGSMTSPFADASDLYWEDTKIKALKNTILNDLEKCRQIQQFWYRTVLRLIEMLAFFVIRRYDSKGRKNATNDQFHWCPLYLVLFIYFFNFLFQSAFKSMHVHKKKINKALIFFYTNFYLNIFEVNQLAGV